MEKHDTANRGRPACFSVLSNSFELLSFGELLRPVRPGIDRPIKRIPILSGKSEYGAARLWDIRVEIA